jgi:hypothetical protein
MPGVRPLCTNQPRGIRIALALQKILKEAVAGSPLQCKGADMERLFKLVYFAGMLAEIILRMPYERQRRKIPKLDEMVPPDALQRCRRRRRRGAPTELDAEPGPMRLVDGAGPENALDEQPA